MGGRCLLGTCMTWPCLSPGRPRATRAGLLAQGPTAPDAVSGAGQGWGMGLRSQV